ncbi:MAG: hypothetical protein KBS97_04315 [Firmicutes bacterium]|nr:hypothetical protein [Candidatus Fiminaster equi]
MSSNINNLFQLSKKDDAYLDVLTKELINKGKRLAVSIIKTSGLHCFVLEDFEDYILDIIVYILANYNSKTKTFDEFATYVLFKRITSKIKDSYLSRSMFVCSLDDLTDDGVPYIELFPDKNIINIPDEISYEELNLKMCSPKNNDTETQRTKKRILVLLKAGYTSAEIKKILNLTEGSYRYILSLVTEMK